MVINIILNNLLVSLVYESLTKYIVIFIHVCVFDVHDGTIDIFALIKF
jgi:hypothetical protein